MTSNPESLRVRMDDQDWGILRAKCEAHGLALSTLVRHAIRAYPDQPVTSAQTEGVADEEKAARIEALRQAHDDERRARDRKDREG